MGALEPRHFLSGGLSALPSDANGVPFNAASIDAGGNLIANMRANVAAEAIGRTLAARLLELTDDPGMKDLLKFLIARDTMHQQQWLAVLEELGPEQATNAPGDFENEPDYRRHAYAFFNHTMDSPMPTDARWTSGPSLDGKGEFTLVEPAPASGRSPPCRRPRPRSTPARRQRRPAGAETPGGSPAPSAAPWRRSRLVVEPQAGPCRRPPLAGGRGRPPAQAAATGRGGARVARRTGDHGPRRRPPTAALRPGASATTPLRTANRGSGSIGPWSGGASSAMVTS